MAYSSDISGKFGGLGSYVLSIQENAYAKDRVKSVSEERKRKRHQESVPSEEQPSQENPAKPKDDIDRYV